MSLTTERPSELSALEEQVDERLAGEEGNLEADVEAAADAAGGGAPVEPDRNPIRLGIAVAMPTIAAGVMVGGIFQGIGARLYAVLGGILGVALALGARKVRKPLLLNTLIVVGLFGIGLVVVLPTGPKNLFNIQALAQVAADSGRVLRPPVPFTPGWQAIAGWLMGIVGFSGVWCAVVVRRPSLGLVIPLPVAAIAAVSVPKSQQVGSGLAVLALFAVGLGVLSSAQTLGDDDTKLPLSYELRKAGKSVLLLVPVLAVLYVAAQSNFLFPKPAIDPTQKAQKPKVAPLSTVPDRVLFTVATKQPKIPLRTGSLDIYDGKDWLLAPFADTRLKDIPRDGVVDREVTAGAEADFTVAGLTGAVLPSLPNPVGIVAEGPKLAYDSRTSNLRVGQGQVQAGLRYSVTAEALPSADDLRKVSAPLPATVTQFAQIAPPPPAVVDLEARVSHANKWDEWNEMRLYVLNNVVTTGLGTPVSVPVSRVQQILSNPTGGASPFEIVAIEALLARWVGIPSRIGYGFKINAVDPEVIDGRYQLRPKDGVAFPEVYFPGFKWLPVIGDPKLAKPTVASNNLQQNNPNTQASNDISVQVFLPILVPPPGTLVAQLRQDLLIGLPILALLGLLYVLYPALRKSRLRARRRRAALAAGPRARIALAYAEFRDALTDFGFRAGTDTPLMFLDRVAPDEEHEELAWLTTRALWGDLRSEMSDELAQAAERLSRSLRRRAAAAQPATLRAIAVVSRLSLRQPYTPDVELPRAARKERRRALESLPV